MSEYQKSGTEFTPGTTDFKTLILKLKQKQIDSLFLNPQVDASLIQMITQLRQISLTVPLYSIYYGASETVMKQAPDLLNDMEFADLPDISERTSEEGKRILDSVRSESGIGFADILVLTSYESFRALDSAISSREDPIEHLNKTSFKGTFGDWSFDKNGDISGLDFVIKKIKDQKPVTISQ